MDPGLARRQPVVIEPVVPCKEPASEGAAKLMRGQTQDYRRAGPRLREVWSSMWM